MITSVSSELFEIITDIYGKGEFEEKKGIRKETTIHRLENGQSDLYGADDQIKSVF